MSKKIDAALKDLKKALEAHADVVGGSAVSLKKAQRASAKVSAAASAYADAVHSKSGLASPFGDLLTPGLEESTLVSLTAERDSIKQHLTGPVPVQVPAEVDAAEAHDAEEHPAAEVAHDEQNHDGHDHPHS